MITYEDIKKERDKHKKEEEELQRKLRKIRIEELRAKG